ncbi:hypothetical protein [Hydrogenimonas sp.]
MSLLRETEEQLASFGPLKRGVVTAAALSMIVAGGWYGWIEETQMQIEQVAARTAQLERQIGQADLRKLTKRIENIRRKRLEATEKLHENERAVRYLRTKMERIEKIGFDQEREAELLDAILKRSVDLGLRIDRVESVNDPADVTPLLERRKRLRIEGEGSFARIVKLTHYIESLNMLAKIGSLGLSLDKNGATLFTIDLLAYGVKR